MFFRSTGLRNTFARRGVFATPDPRKAHGTEDAFFATPSAIAVADGVGGWGSHGINAGLFARSVMKGALDYINETPTGEVTALELLDAGYRHVLDENVPGSAPVAACSLMHGGHKLSVQNVGDCAVMVVRGENVVYRSTELQHRFNCPYQLSSRGAGDGTRPSHGEKAMISVQDGDVVIVASDGVFDNIEDEVARDIILKNQKQSAEWTCKNVAEEIGTAAVRAGKQTTGLLPFGKRALEMTGQRFDGGKVDDVTVVVARICDKDHPIQETCPITMDEVIPVKPMATKRKGFFG